MHRQPGRALAVEAQNVREHRPERRTQQVALLPEHRGQAAARPFEIGILQADGERHLGLDALHPERIEQGDQVRVGLFVEDEEAGIDWMGFPVHRHIDRVRVPAEARRRFEHGHPAMLAKQPGAGQSGDTGADDSDALCFFHDSFPES